MIKSLKRCHIVLLVDEKKSNRNKVQMRTQLSKKKTIEVLEESLNYLNRKGEKGNEKDGNNFNES